MSQTVKVMGLGCATFVGAVAIAAIIIGSIGPDTAVYTGRQMPKRFMATVRSLSLLEEGEQIRYFYSDALLDIKAGLFFVTDKNLVLYSSEWEEPEIIVPLDQIASVEAQYNDSFFEDTTVYVTTNSGIEVTFPVSSENGMDKKFVEAIKENLNIEPGTPADADKPRR